jgi:hypothetical protein
MKIVYLGITVLLLLISIRYYASHKRICTKSTGACYTVKNNSLSQQSADLLDQININLKKLVYYCLNSNPKPVYLKNLEKFNTKNLSENIINLDTTYTINKGDSMVFCLGPRNSESPILYDINTMMYVAVHELAHVASHSVGHTNEFKINFKDLLEKAVKIGIYSYVNYEKTPVEYCGIKLTKNILN